MINVKYFGSRLLKIEEKSYNIHRVNPLYFIVDKVDIT